MFHMTTLLLSTGLPKHMLCKDVGPIPVLGAGMIEAKLCCRVGQISSDWAVRLERDPKRSPTPSSSALFCCPVCPDMDGCWSTTKQCCFSKGLKAKGNQSHGSQSKHVVQIGTCPQATHHELIELFVKRVEVLACRQVVFPPSVCVHDPSTGCTWWPSDTRQPVGWMLRHAYAIDVVWMSYTNAQQAKAMIVNVSL